MVQAFPQPNGTPACPHFSVFIDGKPTWVMPTGVASFACCSFSGSVTVEVRCNVPFETASLRPLSKVRTFSIENDRLQIPLASPQNLWIDIPNLPPLYLFCSPIRPVPDRNDPNVIWFEGGKVHDVGELHLQAGQTCYLEGGALVQGTIRAHQANGLCLRGPGILDGSLLLAQGKRSRSVVIEESEQVLVQDLTMIHPAGWMLTLGACQQVEVQNLHQIGEIIGSDGVDVVGCQDVLIQDNFQRNNDDCIAIKSLSAVGRDPTISASWMKDVCRIRVQNCALANDRAGNVLEIGHELRTDWIEDIEFLDLDLLHCHGHGAPLSIHNGDRATVRNITYRNLRIEHYYDKLIDFRIMRSRFNRDETRGHIHDINIDQIYCRESDMNPGYTVSTIGGWDADHLVDRIRFSDFYLNDRKVLQADDLDLHTRHIGSIKFD